MKRVNKEDAVFFTLREVRRMREAGQMSPRAKAPRPLKPPANAPPRRKPVAGTVNQTQADQELAGIGVVFSASSPAASVPR